MKTLTLLPTLLPLAGLLVLAGCTTEVVTTGGPQPAPAGGQPKMQEALAQLQTARAELQAAVANKGGHREQALQLVDQAINQVQAGMAYAAH